MFYSRHFHILAYMVVLFIDYPMLPRPGVWCGIRPIPFPPSLSERRRLRHLLTFQSSFLSPYPLISPSLRLNRMANFFMDDTECQFLKPDPKVPARYPYPK